MNRQEVWKSAAEDVPGEARSAASVTDNIARDISNGDMSSLAADGKELAELGMAYANRTVRENPTLVLAGVVAVGAIAAMVLLPRRREPQSTARKLQRDFARQTRDLRNSMQRELRDSGVSDKFDDVSRTLSSLDWKPYLQPFLDQAMSVASKANEKISSTLKS